MPKRIFRVYPKGRNYYYKIGYAKDKEGRKLANFLGYKKVKGTKYKYRKKVFR